MIPALRELEDDFYELVTLILLKPLWKSLRVMRRLIQSPDDSVCYHSQLEDYTTLIEHSIQYQGIATKWI